MEALFLTPAELVELTGRKTSAGQRCWLDANGYRFALNANSRPIVARGHVLARLGASEAESSAPVASAPRPNFDAIARAS
ncbi:MAG: DUF4224 domain-containing protein [Sulfuritalea sp.]|nr:DUF4224 domain-containing protein [Sulfuritalea sp.]